MGYGFKDSVDPIKQVTLKKLKRRPPKLMKDQVKKIIEFISILKQNQQMLYDHLINILNLDISIYSVGCDA